MTSTTTPKKRVSRTRKAAPKPTKTETYPVVITKEENPLNLLDLSILSFLYLEYFTKLIMKRV